LPTSLTLGGIGCAVHKLDELESAMVDLRHRDGSVLIEVSLDPELIAVSLAL